jgi:peptidoglycan/xylan/chitin deacetylase (PgdA/CDA1 family)
VLSCDLLRMLLPVALALLWVTQVFIPIQAAPATVGKRQTTPTLITSCTVPNTAALTFDDGPYMWIKNISDQLYEAGARGTFFVNGNNWDCIYSEDNVLGVQYAYAHEHQIASHTWSHPYLTSLSATDIGAQFDQINQALQRVLGLTPAFMRPPYGAYNDEILQIVGQRNQTPITWDFDSGDSTGFTPAQSMAAYDKLVQSHPSTILTLNHETYEGTITTVLPHAISVLKAAGYQLVTVAQCLDMPPYLSVELPQNGTWTC